MAIAFLKARRSVAGSIMVNTRRLATDAKKKKTKIFSSSAAAVADISSGSSLLIGGFGPSGLPQNLIKAIKDTSVRDLHITSNNAGE